MNLSEIFKFLKYPKSSLIKNNDYEFIFKFKDVQLILFKEFNTFRDVISYGDNFRDSGEIPVLISKLDNTFFVFKKYLDEPLKLDFDKLITNYNYHALGKYLHLDDLDVSYSPLLLKLILADALIRQGVLKRDNFKKIYNKSFEELAGDRVNLERFLDYLKKRFKGDIFSLEASSDYDQGLFFNLPSKFIISSLFKNNKGSGVYQTPQSMVDYIIFKTINKRKNLRVLDPACGSGVFLITAFLKLVKNRDPLETLTGSIFGVDSSVEAVNITILSLYIALVEHSDDFSDFEFPSLKNVNIFHEDFFSKNLDSLGLFDVIVGNIPWFHAKGGVKLFEKYAESNCIPCSNRQIAEAYIPRVSDFLSENGVSSLVLTGKILFNLRDYKFRRYLLNNFNIIEIFDLTLIRNTLFRDTQWPCFILTFNCQKQENPVKHISARDNVVNNILFAPVSVKYIEKQCFLVNDWLFKMLLVGSRDDFNLITKLKNNNITLQEFILKHPRLKAGVGFTKSDNPGDTDISDFLDMDFVNIGKGDLSPYFIRPSDKWKHSYKKGGKNELHYAPFILMKAGFSKSFQFVAAFSGRNLAFNQNVFAVKGSVKDIGLLKNITALINSDLFRYFFYMTGNVNVEKNRSPFRERLKFPVSEKIINNEELFRLVCLREFKNSNQYMLDYKINNEIFKAYDLSEDEIRLVRKIQ